MDGGGVGAAALVGAGHDAGVGAEGVGFGEVTGLAEFACNSCSEDEANAWNAGEKGVGSGGEDEGGLGAEGFGVAVEALVEVDGGGEALLQHGDAVGLGWKNFVREGDELGCGFFGMMDVMESKCFGEGYRASSCDFWGAEALFHEDEGRFCEGGDSAFGVIEEAWEKLINEGVDAIARGRFLSDKVAAGAVDFA